jgi:hypothetical protein
MEMIFINVWNIYKEIKWFLGSLPLSQCGGQFALVEHFVFVDLSLNLMMNEIQLFLICILLAHVCRKL